MNSHKARRFTHLAKDNRGITLVETMVAIALLVIGSLILATGFSTAGSLVRHGTVLKNQGQLLAAITDGVPGHKEVMFQDGIKGSITFQLDGTTKTIEGVYRTTYIYELGDQSIKFNIFTSLTENLANKSQ